VLPPPGYAPPAAPPPAYQPPGAPQPAYPPPGYAQPGYPPPGSSQPGYPPPSYPQGGYYPPAYPVAPRPESDAEREAREAREERAKPKRSVAIATNLWNLAVGAIGLEVGIRLADFASFNVNGLYWRSLPGSSDSDTDQIGLLGGGFGFQFFPSSGRTFKGLYIYPSVAFLKPRDSSDTTVGFGATVGYQFLLDMGLFFRVGGGLVHYSYPGDSGTSDVFGMPGITLPNLDGHIGFAF
jgi:hypothetical protein